LATTKGAPNAEKLVRTIHCRFPLYLSGAVRPSIPITALSSPTRDPIGPLVRKEARWRAVREDSPSAGVCLKSRQIHRMEPVRLGGRLEGAVCTPIIQIIYNRISRGLWQEECRETVSHFMGDVRRLPLVKPTSLSLRVCPSHGGGLRAHAGGTKRHPANAAAGPTSLYRWAAEAAEDRSAAPCDSKPRRHPTWCQPPEAVLFRGLISAFPAESRADQPSARDKYGLKHGSSSRPLAVALLVLYTTLPRAH
jgi:hypothetical protein